MELYKYAIDVEKQYVEFLFSRKQLIENRFMLRNNRFSTEIRVPFENSPYIKVFFLDDSVASRAKVAVETLNCGNYSAPHGMRLSTSRVNNS